VAGTPEQTQFTNGFKTEMRKLSAAERYFTETADLKLYTFLHESSSIVPTESVLVLNFIPAFFSRIAKTVPHSAYIRTIVEQPRHREKINSTLARHNRSIVATSIPTMANDW